ncbi:MAG: 4Fe-4S dicluster domain-containing protein, partial [Arenimonas sp.]
LYVSEKKIYPREIKGRFQFLQRLALLVLLGLYYLVAWLPWDGRQAVLWDLPARKFYIFNLVFWPQDFIFLALLLIMAGLALFFFTALAGRLWCGYACPQTVWTEAFLWIEQKLEGDRNQRMKLDASAWTANKFFRKFGKHSLWLILALWTGFTFVGYFTPIKELAARFAPYDWSHWELFWVLFYSFATWGNAGFMREQVCKYMCPYARFQAVMFDRNTLIIAYDSLRGETRGSRRKGSLASVLERARGLLPISKLNESGFVSFTPTNSKPAAEELGDCIDCTLCVQVCPTGIDIREGLQYECIACGACIDACDSIMDKLDYPKGLIRYTTQNQLEGKSSRVLRPRILIYGFLLLALLALFGIGIAQRNPLIVDVMRDKQLYRINNDGEIENAYTLRIINKDVQAHTYQLRIESSNAIELENAKDEISLASEEVQTLPITLTANAGKVRGIAEVKFILQQTDGKANAKVIEESRFIAPTQSP